MYCPECHEEYRDGFSICAECGATLLQGELPTPEDPDHLELKTILTSSSSAVIGVAKSILMSADIEFMVRGENVQDLFALGRFPAGFNSFTGPMTIQVPAEVAADARCLLDGFANEAELEPEPSGGTDSPEDDVSILTPGTRAMGITGAVVLVVMAFAVLFGTAL